MILQTAANRQRGRRFPSLPASRLSRLTRSLAIGQNFDRDPRFRPAQRLIYNSRLYGIVALAAIVRCTEITENDNT